MSQISLLWPSRTLTNCSTADHQNMLILWQSGQESLRNYKRHCKCFHICHVRPLSGFHCVFLQSHIWKRNWVELKSGSDHKSSKRMEHHTHTTTCLLRLGSDAHPHMILIWYSVHVSSSVGPMLVLKYWCISHQPANITMPERKGAIVYVDLLSVPEQKFFTEC